MGTFLQDANMVGAMNLIQGSNSSAVAVENTGNVTAQAVQNELKAMDDIQRALLPTLMCAAASQGFTNDLSDMIFSDTGGTGETSSAEFARTGDYDNRCVFANTFCPT
jgi:hypothetical protein